MAEIAVLRFGQDPGQAAGLQVAERRPAAVEDVGAELFVEVTKVVGDVVEDQRQGERRVLVLEAGVGVKDGAVAEVRAGLLDNLAVGPVPLNPSAVLLVVHLLLPVVALVVGTPGKRARQHRPNQSSCASAGSAGPRLVRLRPRLLGEVVRCLRMGGR